MQNAPQSSKTLFQEKWETEMPEIKEVGQKITLCWGWIATVTKIDGDSATLESGNCLTLAKRKNGKWTHSNCLIDKRALVKVKIV